MSNLKERIQELITRDKIREEGIIPLEDNDGLSIFSTAFELKNDMEVENVETLFVKPALISLVRELARRCQSAEIGEPFCFVEGGMRVTIYFPVLEKGEPTIFIRFKARTQRTYASFGGVEIELNDVDPDTAASARIKEAYERHGKTSGVGVMALPYTEELWNDFKKVSK